jgi:hypothetical protein
MDLVDGIEIFLKERLKIETIGSSPMLRSPVAPDLSLLLRLDQIPPAPSRKPRAKPVYRPHSKFTPEEDFKLRQLVGEHGPNAWRAIAKLMPDRNSRQCRERWLNYLNPNLNTEPWTAAEDCLLEQTYAALGPRWVYITQFFPSRTDAMLKNRFQVLQRKGQRGPTEDASSALPPQSAGAQGEPQSVGGEIPFFIDDPDRDNDVVRLFGDPFAADFLF